ncbi:MAG TPA: hypothetical protein VGD53_27060 [Actinoallomurus sp.]
MSGLCRTWSGDAAEGLNAERSPPLADALALTAVLAEESRRAYARAAELFEAIGDAEASSRCHDLATAAP